MQQVNAMSNGHLLALLLLDTGFNLSTLKYWWSEAKINREWAIEISEWHPPSRILRLTKENPG
jgi:hypothetical protein